MTQQKSDQALATTALTAENRLRMQQLTDWLNDVFSGQEYHLTSLPGDASFRRYHRIALTQMDDTSEAVTQSESTVRYIIMDAPPQKESITEFVAVDELLAAVVNVPTIIAKDMQQGFLVLQDFGTTEFAHLLQQLPEDGQKAQRVNDYYQWAMRTLIELQGLDINQARQQANLPDYDVNKLNDEMALFSDWFLPYFDISMSTSAQQVWQQLTQWLTKQITSQPQVVVHRDYHSRNLMLDRQNVDKLGVIDFQDAVIGAYSYDLLSLLRDAYVNWDEQTIKDWVSDFWQYQQSSGLKTAATADEFYQDMNIVGVQRHLKILGIFIRLAKRDGKLRYLADIAKVMQDLRFELAWLSQQGDVEAQEAVAAFTQWFEAEVVPVYEQKQHLLG
ncbi:aminoglycoside phosphotransferase family protein [Psychrobacter sp. I-STPA10]|uniref:aminoglycoside phosphotransferase family protein n=1 Tax=Psychrobacter sp. I-STPA10 TaxID=2585769 RepID=UPI001E5A9DF0|nr:phosphotransferase [Psychrobacter sp. I-STPA10]